MANTSIGSLEPITKSRAPIVSKDGTGFITSLELYLGDIIGIITILAALFFIVYAFLAAYQMITAGGDSGKVTKAKDRLTWGVLGLVLIVATYSIIDLIGSLVGISILDPATMIDDIVRPTGI